MLTEVSASDQNTRMSDFDEFERQLSENKQGEYKCSLLTALSCDHLHNIVITKHGVCCEYTVTC